MRVSFTCLLLALATHAALLAQPNFYQAYPFTEADTLRGALRPERTCYDVTFYGLHLTVDPDQRTLEGYVDIQFVAVADFTKLQIDLAANLTIDRIVAHQQELTYQRRHDAVFVKFPQTVPAGSVGSMRVHYHGAPQAATNPPWDGGMVWSQDKRGNPWIGVACEGDGASLWWPNKDHLSDEPDSVLISVRAPQGLTCVANGNLREQVDEGAYTRFDWFVSYPINNYNVTINIGKYAHFDDEYYAADGDTLALDYYVLEYNLDKARTHFKQVHQVLATYERYLDKYPYWNDGFALVETPYLGMEHQSAIAYGNRYMRGYLGGMIPRGMDWDYIIVHETGHEYFGNSVSCQDIADMWIHESFTTYLEAVYVEHVYDSAAAVSYLASQRPFIRNREPIVGPPHVNFDNWEGSDHYYKGAWMLHTLRHALHNDERWWALFKDLYRRFAHTNTNTAEIVAFINQYTGRNWDAFFEQYLNYTQPPVLRYQTTTTPQGLQVRYRWQADVAGFDLPVLLGHRQHFTQVQPITTAWRETLLPGLSEADFAVATQLMYIKIKRED